MPLQFRPGWQFKSITPSVQIESILLSTVCCECTNLIRGPYVTNVKWFQIKSQTSIKTSPPDQMQPPLKTKIENIKFQLSVRCACTNSKWWLFKMFCQFQASIRSHVCLSFCEAKKNIKTLLFEIDLKKKFNERATTEKRQEICAHSEMGCGRKSKIEFTFESPPSFRPPGSGMLCNAIVLVSCELWKGVRESWLMWLRRESLQEIFEHKFSFFFFVGVCTSGCEVGKGLRRKLGRKHSLPFLVHVWGTTAQKMRGKMDDLVVRKAHFHAVGAAKINLNFCFIESIA